LVSVAIFTLSQMGVNTTSGSLVLRMVFVGIGLGITFPIFTLSVQNAFEHSRMGVATASTQLFRSIGGTVGTAILGGVLASRLNTFPTKTKLAFATSLREVFFIASIFMTASFIVSFFLKEIPLRKTHEALSEEVGKELAAEEGTLPAKDEPTIIS